MSKKLTKREVEDIATCLSLIDDTEWPNEEYQRLKRAREAVS